MSKTGWIRAGAAATVALIAALALLWPRAAGIEQSTRAAQNKQVTRAGCTVTQKITYTRCGHSVTRRVALEDAVIGADYGEVAKHYADWLLTGFSPSDIEMSRALTMHCPAHYVLMPDGSGTLSVFQNEYGDGLLFLRGLDVPLSSVPEDARSSLTEGIGFDTLEALEEYLEALDS